MTETSVARDTVACFRHEGEDCPRCGGTGRRPVKVCVACSEPGGSVSAGTGAPLVGKKGGKLFHVRCKPGNSAAATMFVGL